MLVSHSLSSQPVANQPFSTGEQLYRLRIETQPMPDQQERHCTKGDRDSDYLAAQPDQRI